MADSDWTEVGGGDNAEAWDGLGTVVGKYVSKRTNVGPNASNMYILHADAGEIGVWGSTVIDSKFESVEVGSLVKIEALGKVTGQKGNSYKDYRVMVKPAVPTLVSDAFPGAELAS